MIIKYVDLHNKGWPVTVRGGLASLAASIRWSGKASEEQGVVEQNLKLSEGLSHLKRKSLER